MADLTKMFNPDSVAVVGASNSEGKVGYIILNNIVNDGFKGNIYPVNPKDDIVQGLKAYKNVSARFGNYFNSKRRCKRHCKGMRGIWS